MYVPLYSTRYVHMYNTQSLNPCTIYACMYLYCTCTKHTDTNKRYGVRSTEYFVNTVYTDTSKPK